KQLSSTAMRPDGSVITTSQSFYYALDGIHLADTLSFDGVNFSDFLWAGEGQLNAVDYGGKTYAVGNSLIPVLPLHKLLGINYSGLIIPDQVTIPGSSAEGKSVLESYFSNLMRVSNGSG